MRRVNKGSDGWMASSTQWTWVWANSGRQWMTGKPDVLWSPESQRVRHNWATEQKVGYAFASHFTHSERQSPCSENTGSPHPLCLLLFCFAPPSCHFVCWVPHFSLSMSSLFLSECLHTCCSCCLDHSSFLKTQLGFLIFFKSLLKNPTLD